MRSHEVWSVAGNIDYNRSFSAYKKCRQTFHLQQGRYRYTYRDLTLFNRLFGIQPNTQVTDAVGDAVAQNHADCRCSWNLISRNPRIADSSIEKLLLHSWFGGMFNLEDWKYSELWMLFANRKITEPFLAAAASNKYQADTILRRLLESDPGAEITDTVMISALRNRGNEGVVMAVLVKAKNINITGSVLMEEVDHCQRQSPGITCLLQSDTVISLTEVVLLKLVANQKYGHPTLAMLGGNRVTASITERILTPGDAGCGECRVDYENNPQLGLKNHDNGSGYNIGLAKLLLGMESDQMTTVRSEERLDHRGSCGSDCAI